MTEKLITVYSNQESGFMRWGDETYEIKDHALHVPHRFASYLVNYRAGSFMRYEPTWYKGYLKEKASKEKQEKASVKKLELEEND